MAVFTDAGGSGDDLKFDAMLPVDAPADVKLNLDPGVSLAQTPGGKALRFEHRGPYDDIDSTYDAIAAYLDAKGLEAGNVYAEEFLTDAKDADDVKLTGRHSRLHEMMRFPRESCGNSYDRRGMRRPRRRHSDLRSAAAMASPMAAVETATTNLTSTGT